MISTEEPRLVIKTSNDQNFLQSPLLTEAAELQIVADIFAAIEAECGIAVDVADSLERERRIAELCAAKISDEDVRGQQLRAAENQLCAEIQAWKRELNARDENFSAFDLRGYCDDAERKIKPEEFIALAGFYRNSAPSPAVLSKFDFAVTRSFTHIGKNNRRTLRLEADKVVAELRALNIRWMGDKFCSNKERVGVAVRSLAELSGKIKACKSLDWWFAANIFGEIRSGKAKIDQDVFLPEVSAALVVANIVIGNHFYALGEAAKPQLKHAARDFFASDDDSESVIENELNRIFQTLNFIALEEDFSETATAERLLNLINLPNGDERSLKVVAPPKNVAKNNAETVEASPKQAENTAESSTNDSAPENSPRNLSDGVEAFDSAKLDGFLTTIPESSPARFESTELRTALEEIAKPAPDLRILNDYLRKSVTREIIELRSDVFFNKSADFTDETEQQFLNRALQLILRAEDAVRLIEKSSQMPTLDFQTEIDALNEQLQFVINHLRRSMRAVAPEKDVDGTRRAQFDALLYATNTLVETQLRLNSAVTRRQNQSDEEEKERARQAQAETADARVFEISKAQMGKIRLEVGTTKAIKKSTASKIKINSLLIVLAVVSLLIGAGGGFYLMMTPAVDAETAQSKFVKIEATRLSGGEHLKSARVNKETLFASAKDSWSNLSDGQKREHITTLYKQSEKLKFNAIVIFDQNNKVAASFSETGEITLK